MTCPRSLGTVGQEPKTGGFTVPLALGEMSPPPRPNPLQQPREPAQAAGRAGLEGLGGAKAAAASKSSPAGGLDRIWVGLHQRNKGGCRRLYLGEMGQEVGVLASALSGTWMEARSEIWALIPATGSPISLPQGVDLTSLDRGQGVSWGGVRWRG